MAFRSLTPPVAIFQFIRMIRTTRSGEKTGFTSIGADKKGQLWITSGEGLTKLIPPSDSLIHFHYNPKDSSGLTGEFLSSSIADKDDNLWISASYTSRGINRLKPGHSSFTHYLTNYPINCMYLDHANVIWAGTDNGIFHFDKATDSFLALHDQRAEVDKVSIKAMVEDNDNNLWISSPSAIFKIDSARPQYPGLRFQIWNYNRQPQ
jgi:ligand-binding sensor domain-containing protein